MADRRRFLQVLGATACLSVCPLGCAVDAPPARTFGGDDGAGGDGDGGGGGGELPEHLVEAGNASELAAGDLVGLEESSLYVGRDAAGIYSMSSVCTHAGCDMLTKGVLDPVGPICACHKSKFDRNGAVLNGPAQKPLPHYLVIIEADGTILIDPLELVSSDFRAAAASSSPAILLRTTA